MFRVPSADSENSNSNAASSNMPTAVTAVDQESASSSQSSAVTAPNMSTTVNSADYNDMDMSENNVPESSLPAPKEESIFSSMTSSSSSSSVPSTPPTPPTQVTGKTTARCPKGSRRNKKSGNCDPAPRKSKGNRKSNNGQITRKRETTNIGRIRALEHTQDAILAKLMELEEAKK